jgi:hypothetical protein
MTDKELDRILSNLWLRYQEDDKSFPEAEQEAKTAINQLLLKARRKELAQLKAAYATDLSVETYEALEYLIAELDKEINND